MSSAAPDLEPYGVAPPPRRDPTHAWYVAHQAELRQRYGKGHHVAIDPAQGVVAAGTLAEVHAQLDALGEPSEDSDVVIYVVR